VEAGNTRIIPARARRMARSGIAIMIRVPRKTPMTVVPSRGASRRHRGHGNSARPIWKTSIRMLGMSRRA